MTEEFQFCLRQEPDQSFVKPGHGLISSSIARLWTVVGSSIAITIFDHRNQMGGMTHFARPYRRPEWPSTAIFAAPAIFWLLTQLRGLGARREDLEAQVFGGASLPEHPDYIPGLHEENISVSLELLQKEAIRIDTIDVGGNRGRKVVFNARTGETAVARVAQIRLPDWYPQIQSIG